MSQCPFKDLKSLTHITVIKDPLNGWELNAPLTPHNFPQCSGWASAGLGGIQVWIQVLVQARWLGQSWILQQNENKLLRKIERNRPGILLSRSRDFSANIYECLEWRTYSYSSEGAIIDKFLLFHLSIQCIWNQSNLNNNEPFKVQTS